MTYPGHRFRPLVFAIVLSSLGVGPAASQSLEEQTRRPSGTNSLTDDSDRMRGNDDAPPSDSLNDDSMNLRGRTKDQDGTSSLDDGSLQGGDQADPGDDQDAD